MSSSREHEKRTEDWNEVKETARSLPLLLETFSAARSKESN